jgi:hypothetical protein
MKKLIFLIYVLLNSNLAFATGRAEDLGGVIRLEALRAGLPYTSSRVTNASVRADLGDHVRAVLIASVRDQLSYTSSEEEYRRLSEMIYRSYIEIRNIGGRPVALILGKFASKYGTDNRNFRNYIFRDEFEQTARSGYILGLAVGLDEELLGLTIEATLHRPYLSGDQNLGLPGGSFTLKKEILKNLVVKYSSLLNLDLQHSEVKRSLELVYTNQKISTWVNFQKFENVFTAGELISGFSFQVGAEYLIAKNSKLVIQYSVVEDVLSKIETGIEFELKEGRLFLFPSYSLDDRNGDKDENFRILLRYKF